MGVRRARFGALGALLLGMLRPGVAAAVTVQDFEEGRFEALGGITLPYRVFVPPGDGGGEPLPLVLFLHGSGERGTDNVRQVTGQPGFLAFVDEAVQTEHPTLLVAPQLPPNRRWIDETDAVLGLLDALAATYAVDPDRVYVTGLSLGGEGTFALLARAPERFAAAVPMSGFYAGAPAIDAARDVPMWIFHAADDEVVRVEGSRRMVQALTGVGAQVVYTEYATGGHVIWTPAYRTPGLVDWVMAQRRGQPSLTAPVVRLASGGVTATTFDSVIDLAGTAELLGASVRIEGRTGGAAGWSQLGTGPTWRVEGVPLEIGDNRVDVRALDDAETVVYQTFMITQLDEGVPSGGKSGSSCRAAPGTLAAALLALGLGLLIRRRRSAR